MNAPPAPFPPPPGPPDNDERQLELLTVLYFVYGAFATLTGLITGLMAVMALVVGPIPDDAALIARLMGLVMAAFALFLVAQAVLMIVAGTYLRRRKGYVLCMVAAAVACTNIPLGAALGVFAFIVLNRPAVKLRFTQA